MAGSRKNGCSALAFSPTHRAWVTVASSCWSSPLARFRCSCFAWRCLA